MVVLAAAVVHAIFVISPTRLARSSYLYYTHAETCRHILLLSIVLPMFISAFPAMFVAYHATPVERDHTTAEQPFLVIVYLYLRRRRNHRDAVLIYTAYYIATRPRPNEACLFCLFALISVNLSFTRQKRAYGIAATLYSEQRWQKRAVRDAEIASEQVSRKWRRAPVFQHATPPPPRARERTKRVCLGRASRERRLARVASNEPPKSLQSKESLFETCLTRMSPEFVKIEMSSEKTMSESARVLRL